MSKLEENLGITKDRYEEIEEELIKWFHTHMAEATPEKPVRLDPIDVIYAISEFTENKAEACYFGYYLVRFLDRNSDRLIASS